METCKHNNENPKACVQCFNCLPHITNCICKQAQECLHDSGRTCTCNGKWGEPIGRYIGDIQSDSILRQYMNRCREKFLAR